jgi:hypothetical protein
MPKAVLNFRHNAFHRAMRTLAVNRTKTLNFAEVFLSFFVVAINGQVDTRRRHTQNTCALRTASSHPLRRQC